MIPWLKIIHALENFRIAINEKTRMRKSELKDILIVFFRVRDGEVIIIE